MKILVTGSAGFIGYNLIKRIKQMTEWEVWGIDNYHFRSEEEDKLKQARYKDLIKYIDAKYLWTLDMNYKELLFKYLDFHEFDIVIHLASIPGVRDSITKPDIYISNNIGIFNNLLEYYSKNKPPELLIYASSSSVYGNSEQMIEGRRTDAQLNPYAFTKKSMELLAGVYNYLFELKLIGLRFFTVYGPWGRPDMSYYKWVKALYENKPIELYGTGYQERDFTYIDCITEGIIKIIQKGDYENNTGIINMGNSEPVRMNDIIFLLQDIMNKTAIVNQNPFASGDMLKTFNQSSLFENKFGYELNFPITEGMRLFVDWYLEYRNQQLKNEVKRK